MHLSQLRGAALDQFARQITRRHSGQIASRSRQHHQDLTQMYAITLRPGDHTSTFANKLLRPLGSAVLVVLTYEPLDEQSALHMPLSGYRLNFEMDGSASYGCHTNPVFRLEGYRRFKQNAWGNRLDPFRNPSLADLLLRMDARCKVAKQKQLTLPVIPQFPKVLLGFDPSKPPRFEDTIALRRLAAKQIGMRCEQLGANGDELLQRLLHDVWEQQLIYPGQWFNDTGLLLINSELCSQVRLAVQAYEDFSDLVGTQIRNPTRIIQPFRVANPAAQVLSEYSVDTSQDFSQHIPVEVVEAMVLKMRELLGSAALAFSDEEIMDGLTAPKLPLSAWNQALPALRAILDPYFAGAVTDDDLLRASKDPAGPLWASGACRFQVLSRRKESWPWDLFFTPEELSRPLTADLTAAESRQLNSIARRHR